MKQELAHVALVVQDYDTAIDYYTNKLDFDLVEDTKLNEEKRWVLIRPRGGTTSILLAQAANDRQIASIGNQTGGRVFLFLYTDDIERDYRNLIDHNIEIVRQPVVEKWGTVLVFKDLYGNLWDLIQKPIITR